MAELRVCTASRLLDVGAWLMGKPSVATWEERVGYVGVGMELFHFHLLSSNAFLTSRNISYCKAQRFRGKEVKMGKSSWAAAESEAGAWVAACSFPRDGAGEAAKSPSWE